MNFGERSPDKQKPGGHFHASENRLKSGSDHNSCLHPLNWGIFFQKPKFGTEGKTERFLTFLIFQIPPEKIGAIMVIRAPGVPATENLRIIQPGKLIGQKLRGKPLPQKR